MVCYLNLDRVLHAYCCFLGRTWADASELKQVCLWPEDRAPWQVSQLSTQRLQRLGQAQLRWQLQRNLRSHQYTC